VGEGGVVYLSELIDDIFAHLVELLGTLILQYTRIVLYPMLSVFFLF
jgi:hypothetical protein